MVYIPDETEIQNWMLLFLYNKVRTLNDMVDDGCKIMVFRRSLSDLRNTLDILTNKNLIVNNNGAYHITLEGKFHIKSTALIPYLGLNKNNLNVVLEKLKDDCDEEFLSILFDLQNHNSDEVKQAVLVKLGSQYAQDFFQGLKIIHDWFPQT